mmetsp:Transcript_13026/g.21344  ORF Transcript_13026/g.21344 Transcript_13026/m.21344 type:complete len:87 (-) Transcript_13026:556-816(-)
MAAKHNAAKHNEGSAPRVAVRARREGLTTLTMLFTYASFELNTVFGKKRSNKAKKSKTSREEQGHFFFFAHYPFALDENSDNGFEL